MSFFILTGAILLGTIFIVHFAANAMGFRLFYTSLFLSAVLALAVNLIVISMKEVTSPLSVAKILLVVLVASAFVTFINDVLTRYEIKKLQNRRRGRKDEVSEEIAETKEDIIEEEGIEEDTEDFALESEAEDATPAKENIFKRLFNKFSSFTFRKKSEVSKETEFDDEEIATVEGTPAEKTDEAAVGTVDVDDIGANADSREEAVETSGEEEPPKKEGVFKKFFKKKEPPKREKIDISQFADLDAVLDFAYDAKISGKYLDAVDVYEGAIEKYENDPYLPFLFIDLGNVHKAQGEYNAAIDVYEKAVNMPNIQKDLNILRSFEENIDYLKALKIVLRKHKAEHKPFGEIDEAILKEVEGSLNK
ncbi:MAG: hypothetical protein J6M62_08475 [Selenomonadaceae bacterium]|nr:hypothetical protein [Selenomonadaceae bacterium]